jgi:dihydropteroate synthase
MSHLWRTARRDLDYGERALVMAILNVTPDSFSDGGMIGGVDEALRQTEKFIAEGADIIDIGGESTRPGSSRVSIEEETLRVVPVIEAITKRFDIPISVDTSKSEVAERAVAAGAELINDISGLRFDPKIADIAAALKTGLVLMHSRGDFESMHSQPPVSDIVREVSDELRCAIGKARRSGVPDENIVLDIGIGFGKTQEQNLELLAKLDKLTAEFSDYPVLVGTSRKSFIGKLLDGAPVNERLSGSLATTAIAVWNGAKIVRVHDVKETVETLKIVRAVQDQL